MRTAVFLLSVCLSFAACANYAAENCADAWTPRAALQNFAKGAGVNIHFTDPAPGEVKMIADAGFRWVRMDFVWADTEKQRGLYDFSAYDRLIAELDRYQINALFILDYGNPLYTKGKSVRTEEARQAFVRWAVAAAKHFSNRGIVWELFNEPNNQMFWPPEPNVDEYVALALAVGRAFRTEARGEKLIGPATGLDFPFLESCFKAGLLDYWAAVSVHPYRPDDPEIAAGDYCRLRALMSAYSNGRDIPIISSEWGYSTAWRRMNEQKQAETLSRQLLTNLANGIPLSIWYDWSDDGADASEAEHNFGIVRHAHRTNAVEPYEPKPAFLAAKAVNAFLDGATFEKRLSVGGADDFVLLFSRAGVRRIVAWTTSSRAKQLAIPIDGRFVVMNNAGANAGAVSASGGAVSVQLTRAPVYLTPQN